MKGREYTFDVKRCALLVIDMQEYFCNPESSAFVPDAVKILQKVNDLIFFFKKHGRPIFFTQHIDDTKDKDNMMLSWWTEKIARDNPLSEIAEGIDTSCGTVIIKHQYDAFFRTRLEDMLRERRIAQVVVAGVLTNLCCETTARNAFMRGYRVFFVKDATGTYDESMYRGSMVNLSYGFAHIVLTAEILQIRE